MDPLLSRARSVRIMIVPATAGTYYPTGKELGANPSGVIVADVDTRSTTATDSYFAQDGQDPLLRGRAGIIRAIIVLTAGSGSTIAVQSHAGTVLVPAFDGAAAKTVEFGKDGLPIFGGFRIVTAGGTPLLAIAWEPTIVKPVPV